MNDRPLTIFDLLLYAGVFLIVAFGYWIYTFPVHIAKKRGHPDVGSIRKATLLLGWTGICWFGCVFWACSQATAITTVRRDTPQPVDDNQGRMIEPVFGDPPL